MAQPAIVDTISELSALMKTRYGDQLEQQQNLAAMLYKRLSTNEITFGGNSYEFPARMVNRQSIGARGNRAGLPTPKLNIDVTTRVRQKNVYGTFDITGPDIEKGKGNPNAFVNTLTDAMHSLTEMTLKDLNIQCHLDGTGVRATATSAWAGGQATVDRIQYLWVGMDVNVVSSVDGATLRGGGDTDPGELSSVYANTRFTIIAIDAPTRTVTLGAGTPLVATTPTGAAQGDFIVRHKDLGVELTGLGAIVDDGVFNPGANVFQDIDRVANPLWRANVLHNNGAPRDISLQLLQIGMDVAEKRSGRRISDLYGSHNGRDRYLQLLVPQKRFTDLKLDGGFQVLEYNGRDFVVDVDTPDDTIWLLCRETIKKFGLFNLQFVEQTGGILKHDSLASGDVFYGFLRAICNLGATQPNANTAIRDITVDPAYITSH